MQSERRRDEARPILPGGVEDRLVGLLLRAVGIALLAVAAAGWLSLVTWSAQDPSLTHATSGLTRNWLGPLGAIVSDLLLQTLGFVSILVFLALAFTGGELVLNERVGNLKSRLWLMPVAVLALSGAFSSLPAPQSWPLNHGLGGMAGDGVFGFVSGLFAMLNPARAGAVTGLVLFAGGMCLLSAGLGLTQRDWAILVQPSPGRRSLLGRWRSKLPDDIAGRAAGLWAQAQPAWATPSGTEAAAASASPVETYPQREPQPPTARAQAPAEAAPWQPREPVAPPVRLPTPPAIDAMPPERLTTFEHHTEHMSRAMAERFAPRASEPVAAAPAEHAGGASAGALRGAVQGLGGMLSRRPSEVPAYRKPSLNILKRPTAPKAGLEVTQPVLRGSARLLEDVLKDFRVEGEVKDIRPGPVVTLFEFEPARGTKSSRVIALADDIARSMSAVSARVAVVPGRNAMGIELPNVRRETVYLRELMESEAWRGVGGHLPVVLGKGIGGEPVLADLARMPHLLVAGTTGSGKSVGVNAMILSLLYRLGPDELRFLMIDPKMLELSVYNGIPHLLAPVVTDPHLAAAALQWAVSEMEERYKRMAQLGVRNIEIYNNRVRNAKKRGEAMHRTVQTGFDERTGQPLYVKEGLDGEPMPFIVVVVDEFADLMAVAGKEVEGSVQRLAQMARAAGIHLIMATQRPSVDVVTGTIKANFPTRIAFKVASKVDSRTILGDQGAEQLLGAGDMLYSAGSGQVVRVHGPFVSDEEVERIAQALREQGEPQFVEALLRDPDETAAGEAADGPGGATGTSGDDLFDRAVAIVHRDQKASTSYLQRRLGIGYNRAADLIDRMEREGIVSAADHVGRRRVLTGGGGDGSE